MENRKNSTISNPSWHGNNAIVKGSNRRAVELTVAEAGRLGRSPFHTKAFTHGSIVAGT